MYLDITKLQTVNNWAQNYEHNGRKGCAATYAHQLLDPKNSQPVARRVQEEWTLISIDGVKFVAHVDDIMQAPKTGKRSKKHE